MNQTRLNKYISGCGIASRRKADELISEGRVSINGNVVLNPASRVNPETDKVEVDGETIKGEDKIYFLLNKPRGVITSTKDEKNRTTVVDLIKSRKSIYPVGRLDFNTTGVLILTNDGDFSYVLTHPKHKVPRKYLVHLTSILEETHKKKLLKGIFIDGRRGKFVEVDFPKKDNYKIVEVISYEGRNHFVKNMFSALGYTVKKLHRQEYAGFNVEGLEQGNYRPLSKREIDNIYKVYSKQNSKDLVRR